MHQISNRLKYLRNQSNLRQTELAKLLECTEQHYQRIEYGKVNVPMTTLIKLADIFDVSIDYLVGRSDNPNRY